MKFITTLWYKLFDKDFDQKLKSARITRRMIIASTNGRCNHFYDMNGQQIRGYSNEVIRSKVVRDVHPLITKYQ